MHNHVHPGVFHRLDISLESPCSAEVSLAIFQSFENKIHDAILISSDILYFHL